MAGRRWTMLAVLAAAACVVAATAAGGIAAGPPAAALVLQPSDVPGGAKVLSQRHVKVTSPIVDEYRRELAFRTPYGPSKFRAYFDTAFVIATPQVAGMVYGLLEHVYTSPSGRAELLKELRVASSKQKVTLSHVVAHAVAVGDGAFELSMTVKQGAKLSDVSLLVFHLDRVIEVAAAVGSGPLVHPADSAALAKLLQNRVAQALRPASTAPPTISGTAQQGQTLTASPGTWTNSPTTFVYQWQHCDTAGASCTPIAGSNSSTYAVGAGDVGTTLRVTVTASNGGGESEPVPSAPTAVVS